jgi:hypothetical protein
MPDADTTVLQGTLDGLILLVHHSHHLYVAMNRAREVESTRTLTPAAP